MISSGQIRLNLIEYEPTCFAPGEISEEVAYTLYQNHQDKLEVEWPSPKTNWKRRLTAKGWVGYIPLTSDVTVVINPKVPLTNLFGMWEYAYQLKSFHFLDGLIACHSLEEFYEHLASILAKRILDRARQGLYREYAPQRASLPYLRGRLNLTQLLKKPWETSLACNYEEHTADITENQLLIWTLWCILRSGLCRDPQVIATVRRAYLSLHGFAAVQPFHSQACLKRLYNRLNQDYHPLHALCHFFLEHSGPTHQSGDHTMLPFLVNMARLYERFVAEWLKIHLPSEYVLKIQEHVTLDQEGVFSVDLDLVVQHILTGETIVLDTKYKAPEKPSQADIDQMVAYAVFKESRKAVLIYPTELKTPVNISKGHVHVRSLTFALHGDLEQAGQQFLHDALALFNGEQV